MWQCIKSLVRSTSEVLKKIKRRIDTNTRGLVAFLLEEEEDTSEHEQEPEENDAANHKPTAANQRIEEGLIRVDGRVPIQSFLRWM